MPTLEGESASSRGKYPPFRPCSSLYLYPSPFPERRHETKQQRKDARTHGSRSNAQRPDPSHFRKSKDSAVQSRAEPSRAAPLIRGMAPKESEQSPAEAAPAPAERSIPEEARRLLRELAAEWEDVAGCAGSRRWCRSRAP